MGSTTAKEAKKWLMQRKPVPDRVAALITRCADGDMKPSKILMSTDLYTQMVMAAVKSLGKDFDIDNMPETLSVSFNDHEVKIVHDEKMPQASMHATR